MSKPVTQEDIKAFLANVEQTAYLVARDNDAYRRGYLTALIEIADLANVWAEAQAARERGNARGEMERVEREGGAK